ncbi:segregation and condensation protein A [Kiritimatiella glycovorans]|uniref:Segregation and condensation protein A n=1 Tax=Kiritimatiella glycovorans TaxID=1307763 RepID=A0A0G3EFT6_9BACT|nr:segregation/condensation protein A [Kiritimatiella glycovorans]AKJ64272.1 Segregation and condensation protein A [Kiritimatiella glycovorans]
MSGDIDSGAAPVAESKEYKVRLEIFEGPLDLLLYLIKKNELDIYDIPIETITRQYIEYLELMRILDLEIAGEFLVMAATLMMIKSRMLLPEDDRAEEEEEEEDDPRWDLVRQLVEYKKFKDAAGYLEGREEEQGDVFGPEGEHLELGPQPEVAFSDVGIFDLISALNEALERAEPEEVAEIFAEPCSVADMVDEVLRETGGGREIELRSLFTGRKSRQEMVCTFLAVLELIKLNELVAEQEAHFGRIVIRRREGPETAAATVPGDLEEAP